MDWTDRNIGCSLMFQELCRCGYDSNCCVVQAGNDGSKQMTGLAFLLPWVTGTFCSKIIQETKLLRVMMDWNSIQCVATAM